MRPFRIGCRHHFAQVPFGGTGEPGTGSWEWRNWLCAQARGVRREPPHHSHDAPYDNNRCAISLPCAVPPSNHEPSPIHPSGSRLCAHPFSAPFILPGSRFPAHQLTSDTHHNGLLKMGSAPFRIDGSRSPAHPVGRWRSVNEILFLATGLSPCGPARFQQPAPEQPPRKRGLSRPGHVNVRRRRPCTDNLRPTPTLA